ncbi:MAG: ATP-dependent helicase [Treponemataceae bacterium]|nr:ATP-dependent helicase [Spirochaetales bacterium]MDY6031061.1 ATP-dependent helicase [Treponemataceae bacterium]
MNVEDSLSCLNENQLEAVTHFDSPLLILAGAGSGKTRVITTKIAYMISELGIEPYSILAVTFTKKAAGEMQERATRLEPMAAKSQIKTFHSFGSWFLRKHFKEANLDKNFTVYDDDDMESLVLKAIPNIARNQAKGIAQKISLAKDYCLTSEDDLSKIDTDENFPEYYALYQSRLEKTGNVDFGDLIMKSYLLLKNNEQVRNHMNNLFKVVMVDEYQDSNVAQFKLLEQLVGPKTYVCVVGDDDQSIYKFRGAEVENILKFQDVFTGTKVIKLEENYRSVPAVLSLANSVIKNNTKRLGKEMKAVREGNAKAHLTFLPSQNDEVEYVCNLIKKSHSLGVPYASWAVLYRMNSQSQGFESAFLNKKIPYTIVGSLKFYQREEIKDALAYISFFANPKDEISFRRIINKPARGIGAKSQDEIVAIYLDMISNSNYGANLLDASIEFAKKKSGKTRLGLLNFLDRMAKLVKFFGDEENSDFMTPLEKILDNTIGENDGKELVKETVGERKTLSNFIELLIESFGLFEYFQSQDEIGQTQKVSNLKELVNIGLEYPMNRTGLTEFLDHVELDRVLAEKEEEQENPDRVTLITLHNTKGLEFDRVVITGLEDGVFPRLDKVDDELEEERRLFYVGITRARDELYFTSCGYRVMFGKGSYMNCSKFLFELDKNFLQIEGKQPFAFKNSTGPASKGGTVVTEQQARNNALAARWCKGRKLFHDDYGYGYIMSGNDSGCEYVINVQFESGTVKRFMPRYQANHLTLVED